MCVSFGGLKRYVKTMHTVESAPSVSYPYAKECVNLSSDSSVIQCHCFINNPFQGMFSAMTSIVCERKGTPQTHTCTHAVEINRKIKDERKCRKNKQVY